MLDAVTPGTFYKECGNITEAVEKGKSGRRFSEVVTQKIKLGRLELDDQKDCFKKQHWLFL